VNYKGTVAGDTMKPTLEIAGRMRENNSKPLLFDTRSLPRLE